MFRIEARRLGAVLLMASGLIALSGCSDSKKVALSNLNLKQLTLALISYHAAHQEWPDSLEQLKPFIEESGPGAAGRDASFSALMTNPLTGDKPGYEYVKPGSDP